MNVVCQEIQLSEDQLSRLGRLSAADLRTLLEGEPDLVRGSVVEQLGEAVRLLVRLDVEEALRFAEAALAIAALLGDAAALGRAIRAKANALWFKGNLKAAVELFQVSVERFEEAGATAEIGRTLSSCIQPLALLGEYAQAFEAAKRARRIFLQINDRRRMARLEINVANIHHRQDRFQEALASYQRAYDELLPHKDAEAIAAALHNIAVCLIALNDFDKALQVYRRARDLSEANGMPRIAAQADYNIAYLYFLRGEYQTAIDRLRQARELSERTGDAYHAALCDLDRSEVYLELNLAEEAAAVAQRAQEQFENLQMAFETGRSVANRAIALHLLEESPKALELFGQAAEIFGREGNRAWQALIGLYRGLVLLETGQVAPAVRLCRDSLEYFEQTGLERRAILCYLLLARVAESMGQWEEASEHCRAALARLATVEAPLLSYQAHALLGRIATAGGESRLAYRSFLKARREVESLRSSLQGEELKIAFMKNRLDVYQSLVGICLQRRGRSAAETAFGYLEEAKSRSLLDAIYGRATPRSWIGEPGAEGERMRTLRQELNWYYRRIEIEQTRSEVISVREIHNLRQQAHRLEKELEGAVRDAGSSVAGLPLDVPHHVSLEQVRVALGADATLLEFFQVGLRFVAAVVTQDQVRINELCAVSEVAASIRMLEFQMSRRRVKEFENTEMERVRLDAVHSRLQDLYRKLVMPVVDLLRGSHVVVVPHGVLHCLPFHALADGAAYLIDRFTVSYAPSAGIYSMCRERQANSSGSALLLGVNDRHTRWIGNEIRAVAAVVDQPDVRLGRDASVQVLRDAGPSSRLIHIATHGTFRRDNPLFSSVRLADSYLTMYDLHQMRLPVRLLTLSGCGTGLNVVAAGDELLGLMRGMLLAGAASVLVTLWDVNDRSTARFMASFYTHLHNQPDPAVALQKAMRELRQHHRHPFYWAPFVLVGTTKNWI